MLSAHNEQVKPILEPLPNDPHLLPPYDDLKVSFQGIYNANTNCPESNIVYEEFVCSNKIISGFTSLILFNCFLVSTSDINFI